MVSRACVSTEKWLRKEWVGTVPYLITQMTVSLSGSPSATTHTGFSLGQTCQAFSPAVAKRRIIYCYPAHFLPYLPSYFFPPFLGPLVEWSHWVADGQMGIDSVPLRRKLIGRDRKRIAVSLNGPDMMGKSMQGLQVHLHTVRGPRLMFSLQGVIRSFGSTLTSWSDNPFWD